MSEGSEICLAVNACCYDRPQWATELVQSCKDLSSISKTLEKLLLRRRVSEKTRLIYLHRASQYQALVVKKNLSQKQISYICIFDERYPNILKEISYPPVVLYYQGDIRLLERTALGIVGSRDMTLYGRDATDYLTKKLCLQFVIVSGLAQGIDTVAHQTALRCHASTMAVLGTGIDVIYPQKNKEVRAQIQKTGLLLTEFPCGMRSHPSHFPLRNRLISGLSVGVLIIEAAARSGALITARHALEQNRDVFAVPGSIFQSQSMGTNALLAQGAMLVTDPKDILNYYPYLKEIQEDTLQEGKKDISLTPMEKQVWQHIGHDPIHVDDLSYQSQLPIHQLLSIITDFETQNLISCLPGQYIVKKM